MVFADPDVNTVLLAIGEGMVLALILIGGYELGRRIVRMLWRKPATDDAVAMSPELAETYARLAEMDTVIAAHRAHLPSEIIR